jgi:uridine monophosphate synthetase
MITHLSYSERANLCLSPLGQHILQLLDDKQSNLALSADVTEAEKLLELADTLGPEICILKTHIDIISDFTPTLTQELRRLADKHHFLIFEDRKFADIGNTVKQQYSGGIYHISEWAELVNAHILPGPGLVKGIAEVGREKKNRGLLLIAEMSSEGHLLDKAYVQNTLKIAESHADFVIGFITQHALCSDEHWINFTPGVKLKAGKDKLGQQYITPEIAINQNGSDIIIVGRGIIQAADPLAQAQEYRKKGWDCYLERCKS